MIDIASSMAGLTVVDLASGMAPALVSKLLAELGAGVTRFEPAAGDPFASVYPAYPAWHRRAEIVPVATTDDARIDAALAGADACIVGGEDYPGHAWRFDADTLAARHPHLVILVIEGYPGGYRAPAGPAVEILVQARSGLVFEQYSDRPMQLSFAPASHCAALHGLTALMAGLCRRARAGAGEIVRTSLYEGALTLGTQYWMRASQPVLGFNFSIPKDPRQLILKCRDGRYIQIVLGSFGSKGSLYRILGIDDPSVKAEDSGMPTGRGDPKNFFGDVDLLAAHVAAFESDDLLAQVQRAGIAASLVLAPGECWSDPQVDHLGVVAADENGRRAVGLPMRGVFAEAATDDGLHGGAPGDLPLAGVRVLDFGSFVAGPYAGVALADLGADVIKVETPQGDPNRNIYRSYAAVNRGKRAITVDLKNPVGREIAARLIARADVVLNNFRPGVSARLGVDPGSIHAIDPDKIVLEATGFGRSGPYGSQPGFDMIFQAFCGHDVRTGGAGNPPVWDRTAMVDYLLGLLDQVAVLVATWRRFRGGGGADLDLSLLDAGLFLMSELIQSPDGALHGAPPINGTQTGFHPAEALYACRDGWIAIAARGEPMAAALSGIAGLAGRPRALWDDTEASGVATALAALDVAEALARLGEAGVWAEACAPSGDAALHDDGHAPADLIVATDNPTYGRVSQLGALFRLGDGRHTNPRGAPLAGQDTAAILGELGFSGTEIERLNRDKIVA